MDSPSPTPTLPARSLLLVDSDRGFRQQLALALRARGVQVVAACDYDTAMAESVSGRFDWALVSLELDGRSGLFVVRDLHQRVPSTQILLYSLAPCRSLVRDAVKLGALDCVARTDDVDKLFARIADASAPVLEPPPRLNQVETLADVIREHIELTLRRCDGNVKLAAESLNVSRQTIYRWRRRREDGHSIPSDGAG